MFAPWWFSMREPAEVTRRERLLQRDDTLLRLWRALRAQQESNRLTRREATGEKVFGCFLHLATSCLRARCHGALAAEEARLDAGLFGYEEEGLCGLFLGERLRSSSAAALAARSSLRIELTRISQMVSFDVGLRALVLAAAQLALDLDMSALLERGGELAELAEDDATVPFGVLDVLAVLLVRGLGCKAREW